MRENENIELILAYLMAIERVDADAISSLLSPDIRQIEMPNQLKPAGAERDLKHMLGDFATIPKILRSQRYDIEKTLAQGDSVVVHATWTGVLNMSIGKLQAGDAMICHSAMFFELSNGKITRQRNFDCFEPFG